MILFLQPAIPKYRAPFFTKLASELDENIKVIASERDFLNVQSQLDLDYVEFCNGFFKFGPFYWHRKIGIPSLKKTDIAVICGNPWIVNYMLLLIYYKAQGVKVIWWGQGWTAGSYGLLSKIRRRLMHIADGIALYTEKEADELITKKEIIGLNNGLDSDEIKTIISSFKKRKITSENVKLLFIGRLTNKSNILLLLKALCRSKNKIVLHIIGDGELKESVTSYASEHNLNNTVVLHGPVFKESDIAKIAVDCDVFIYPGSVGLSIIHGFNYGLPAIVHSDKSHHMPEFAAFKDGYNGLSFNKDSVDSLTQVLDSLNALTINELSVNAFETVQSSFNVNDMVKRFRKLIKSIR